MTRSSRLTFVALAAAACSSPTAKAPDVPPRDANAPPAVRGLGGASADDYLAAGDPDGAAAMYAAELGKSPGDAALAEKLRTAKRLAAQRHAERAAQAAHEG